MKAKLELLIMMAFTFGTTIQGAAQGVIVPNGVVQANVGNTFAVHVIQDPNDGNYTGFLLFPQGGNTFSPAIFADEGVRVFFVSPNDPISLQPILSQNYSEFLGPTVIANGSPFYLGFFTGKTFPVNGVYSDPLFGWARLVNINGTIQLLDSALEYGGGIYAETQTIIPVPEPGVYALAAVGVAGLFVARRRR